MNSFPPDLPAAIARATGSRLTATPDSRVSGGCIHECFRWQSVSGPLFVKLASGERLDMLEAEQAGLEELAATGSIRVPAVRGTGLVEDTSWLALEWLDLGQRTERCETMLGEQLAALHREGAARFGWRRDNYIGLTPQSNGACADWISFFRDRRLQPQIDLAVRHGYTGAWLDRAALLLERMAALFPGHEFAPSLLHGDLWGGNVATCEGLPVIFDPAVYYGDREADLAMTRLFGGFSARFYEAYGATWPLAPGAEQRVELYNLYHVLNHLNVFGAAYLRQAEQMIERLLFELKA